MPTTKTLHPDTVTARNINELCKNNYDDLVDEIIESLKIEFAKYISNLEKNLNCKSARHAVLKTLVPHSKISPENLRNQQKIIDYIQNLRDRGFEVKHLIEENRKAAQVPHNYHISLDVTCPMTDQDTSN
jgi:flagellar biosynthesis component FlhA